MSVLFPLTAAERGDEQREGGGLERAIERRTAGGVERPEVEAGNGARQFGRILDGGCEQRAAAGLTKNAGRFGCKRVEVVWRAVELEPVIAGYTASKDNGDQAAASLKAQNVFAKIGEDAGALGEDRLGGVVVGVQREVGKPVQARGFEDRRKMLVAGRHSGERSDGVRARCCDERKIPGIQARRYAIILVSDPADHERPPIHQ